MLRRDVRDAKECPGRLSPTPDPCGDLPASVKKIMIRQPEDRRQWIQIWEVS